MRRPASLPVGRILPAQYHLAQDGRLVGRQPLAMPEKTSTNIESVGASAALLQQRPLSDPDEQYQGKKTIPHPLCQPEAEAPKQKR